MIYSIASVALMLLAALIGLGALWVVFRQSLFMSWLKATLAFCVLAAAVVMTLVAVDLIQFKDYRVDVPVAKVKLKRLDNQQFALFLETPQSPVQEFKISGDLWQLDARLIIWNGPFSAIGMRPGYRFERVSGRYHSIEQEQNLERSVHRVEYTNAGVDFWQWLLHNDQIPWVKARYGSATFLPMQDGAEFSVAVGVDGLVAKPLNTPAVEAVQNWK